MASDGKRVVTGDDPLNVGDAGVLHWHGPGDTVERRMDWVQPIMGSPEGLCIVGRKVGVLTVQTAQRVDEVVVNGRRYVPAEER